MKKNYYLIILLSNFFAFAQTSGVGLNETNPQQMLHLGASTSTIRVEGLNEFNNEYNLGAGNTYPLYVDDQGSLTLYNATLYNSNGSDAITDANITNGTVVILNGDNDGIASTEIMSFTVTTTRPSLLLVKYNISFEMFQDAAENKIFDKFARRINTYFKLNNGTRKYCHTSKNFTSSDKTDVNGILYNMSSSYIVIPSAGTHTITIHGEISSGLTSAVANTGKATCAIFGRGQDSLMYKLN